MWPGPGHYGTIVTPLYKYAATGHRGQLGRDQAVRHEELQGGSPRSDLPLGLKTISWCIDWLYV